MGSTCPLSPHGASSVPLQQIFPRYCPLKTIPGQLIYNILLSIDGFSLTYKDSSVGYKITSSDLSVSASFEKHFMILKFNTENIFLSLIDNYVFYFLRKMTSYLYLIIKEKNQNTESNPAMTLSLNPLPIDHIQQLPRDAGAPRLVLGHLSLQYLHPYSHPVPKRSVQSSLSSSSTPHLFSFPHTSCSHKSALGVVFQLFLVVGRLLSPLALTPASSPQLFFFLISIPFPPHPSFYLCSRQTPICAIEMV